jgi:hypothetical protein
MDIAGARHHRAPFCVRAHTRNFKISKFQNGMATANLLNAQVVVKF